jgi:polyhydroxybutyrate depolymerase
LILNGIDDPLVPFQGGYVKVLRQTRGKIISTQDAVDLWVARNHCSNIAKTESLPDTNPEDGTTVIKMIYDQGETGTSVILYKINHGGHTWPGGRQYLGERIVGKTCRDIDACEEIWGFFSKATHY